MGIRLSTVFAIVLALDTPQAWASGKKSSTGAEPKAGEKKAQLCIACHRVGNNLPLVPLLEGQPARYLYDQMKAYKEKRRLDPTTNMQINSAGLSDRDMRDIAQYFSIQPVRRDAHKLDAQKVDAGRARAEAENCAACHSTKGKDQNVPRISGQRPLYLTRQLQAFASGKRAHRSATMAATPVEFSDEDAEALGQYFAQAE